MCVALIVAGIAGPAPALGDERKPRAADASNWFWLEAGLGYQWFDLMTIDANPYELRAEILPTAAGGPAPSAGIGVRAKFVTFGVRATAARLVHRTALMPEDDRWLWTLNGELGLRGPLIAGKVQPYVLLGFGYTTFGGASELGGVSAGFDVDGFNVQASAGCDYFLYRSLSVGLRGGLAALVLSREGVPVRELVGSKPVASLGDAAATMFRADGTSWGAGLEFTSVIAWHF